jgi:methylenetetrahydrofolate dehydrogenase (NADP+) / methenyltetrahydrofolate cyclohydrolase
MKAMVLNGRLEADRLLANLRRLVKKHRRPISLATIMVGQRYDSALYVRLKTKAAADVGIKTINYRLPAKISENRMLKLIHTLNHKTSVNGILLQLPLPRFINTNRVVSAISPRKDVDGFGKNSHVLPPTVAAVLRLLRLARPKARASAVILGQNSIFSERVTRELQRRKCRAVFLPIHQHIPVSVKTADIIITALGRGPRLSAKHIKPGAIVVDIGIRKQGKHTVGDAEPSVWTKAKAVSPVPGGVGPLTVYYLLANTYKLATKR